MLDCLRKSGVPDEDIEIALENFKLAKKLGKGAFGQVFHGIDRKLYCECAIKV